MAKKSENLTNNVEFALSVKHCPPSQVRIPAADLDKFIDKPGLARANLAVSTDVPQGSTSTRHASKFKDYVYHPEPVLIPSNMAVPNKLTIPIIQTVLQQHVLFWDRDGDGVIYPYDTYVGFRELGFNILFCLLAVMIININFSYPTRLALSYLPDPFFRVYVDSIHKAKHGSDSGVYDSEGRFIPQLFENLFSKWDKDNDGALRLSELFSMIKGHRCAADPYGWGANFFEWGTTWLLLQKDGKIYKEDLRQLYDGSLFWRIRDARKSTKGWNQGFGLGGDWFVGGTRM